MSPLFGRLLKDWRTTVLELTLHELEEKLDHAYSASALGRYEQGNRKPKGDFFAYLTLHVGVPEEIVEEWLQALAIEYHAELLSEYRRILKNNNR